MSVDEASVRWMTAMLDTPPEDAVAAERFWLDVTGTRLSARRGPRSEFATLVPVEGDAYLKTQVVPQAVPGGLHLDLHTDDLIALLTRAVALGATVGDRQPDYVVLRSPGGLGLCLVEHAGSRRPPPQQWPAGRSIVDQVCLDIPPSSYDAECAFWRDLTGWEHYAGEHHDEFTRLRRPEGMPLAVLLQRLDDDAPTVSAHLDLAADDREAETARHEALGARVLRRTEHWTVLADPAGRTYCITVRRPGDV
jgi:hypothetical protein